MKQALYRNFKILRFLGFWIEEDEKQSIYRTAFGYANLIIWTFNLSGLIIESLRSSESISDVVDIMLTVSDWLSYYIKIIYFILHRKDMLELRKRLSTKLFCPKTDEEHTIAKQYEWLSGITFKVFAATFCLTTSLLWISPLTTQSLTLPYKTYNFCDVTNPTCFAVFYVLQSYWLFIGVLLCVAIDTLIFGYIILLTGHFHLTLCRLRNFPNRKLNDHFEDHVIAYKFAKETSSGAEDFFSPMLLSTFTAMLFILCTLIYSSSQESNRHKIVELILISIN